MNRRIFELRKDLGLTQEKFAEKIGLSKNFVWMIEKGERVPSDRTISDICREFKVSKKWLCTGEGKMYLQLDQDEELDMIFQAIELSSDDLIKQIVRTYWKLSDEKKAVIKEFISEIAKEQ